ncbi:MAG TPA: type VI secretion system membrane subunit TssM, partial [Burkholderiales bacterium]|nr:type VI secretion system membrane subunit TssM [Burkholderiales bacterium]
MKWLSGLKRPVALSLAGVLALSALVWFEGPLFAFDGHAPLESESRRWIAVALIFACWAIWWGARFVKTRIASSNFVRGLVADALDPAKREPSPAKKAAAADLAILRTRFEEAMKTLRHVQGPSEGK